MKRNWQQVWENRDTDTQNPTLSELIRMDGFDSGFGTFQRNDWLAYIYQFRKHLHIESSEISLYEVGCGAGAFLYPFFQSGHIVGGADYSKTLLTVAQTVMPGMQFDLSSADAFPLEDKYDIVLSNSVFHYFPDHLYALETIDRMIKKAKRYVAILDINDLDKKALADRIRRGTMTQAEYARKYEGLSQLYYEKSWFCDIASAYDMEVSIYDQEIENYPNGRYRFNVILKHRKHL